jgi:hypothetical protein
MVVVHYNAPLVLFGFALSASTMEMATGPDINATGM